MRHAWFSDRLHPQAGQSMAAAAADSLSRRYTYRGPDVQPDPMLAAARMRGVIHLRQLTAARRRQQEEAPSA